jgi:2-phosphoglycerate kinase
MQTKIINLFAGPGAGKSTIASGLMYELKKQHISADNPYEFPKNLAWDENMGAIKDQFYITANQHRNIVRSYGKVDFVVCDSPILFALVYKEKYKKEGDFISSLYGKEFNAFIFNLFNRYDNINYFLERNLNSSYDGGERFQTLEESKMIDKEIKDMLNSYGVNYESIYVDDKTVRKIINQII